MTDIQLTEQLRTEWNDRGDIRTVRDDSALQQQIVIAVVESASLQAPASTPEAIASQRASVEQAVRDCDAAEPPISVTVTSSPRDSSAATTITYRVETAQVDVTLERD